MAEELRCSECGRPCIAEPCGILHAMMRIQLTALRQFLHALLKGADRG